VISTPFASGAGAARVEVGAACRPYPPLGDDRRRPDLRDWSLRGDGGARCSGALV